MNRSWPREPQGRELEDFIQLFKALGDPSRMKILFQIGSSEACVSEIAGRLNLHILRMNGMVHRRRKGKTIYYILKDDHVRWMIAQGCEHIRKL